MERGEPVASLFATPRLGLAARAAGRFSSRVFESEEIPWLRAIGNGETALCVPGWKKLGSGDADAGLVLAFDLSQLITQTRRFGAVLFSFDTVLDSADTAHRIHKLDHGTALAVAGMCELFDKIVLVQGIGLDFINTAVEILDFCPALRLCDGSIADRHGGVLPLPAVVLEIVGENLQIILPLRVSLVGCQTIPSQSPGVVSRNALSELIHPA